MMTVKDLRSVCAPSGFYVAEPKRGMVKYVFDADHYVLDCESQYDSREVESLRQYERTDRVVLVAVLKK